MFGLNINHDLPEISLDPTQITLRHFEIFETFLMHLYLWYIDSFVIKQIIDHISKIQNKSQ